MQQFGSDGSNSGRTASIAKSTCMTLTDMSGSKTDAVQQTRLNPIPPGRFIAAKRKAPVDVGAFKISF